MTIVNDIRSNNPAMIETRLPGKMIELKQDWFWVCPDFGLGDQQLCYDIRPGSKLLKAFNSVFAKNPDCSLFLYEDGLFWAVVEQKTTYNPGDGFGDQIDSGFLNLPNILRFELPVICKKVPILVVKNISDSELEDFYLYHGDIHVLKYRSAEEELFELFDEFKKVYCDSE